MLGDVANILANVEHVLAVIGAMAIVVAAALVVAAHYTKIDTRW